MLFFNLEEWILRKFYLVFFSKANCFQQQKENALVSEPVTWVQILSFLSCPIGNEALTSWTEWSLLDLCTFPFKIQMDSFNFTWFFTGVTAPWSLQSKDSGIVPFGISAFFISVLKLVRVCHGLLTYCLNSSSVRSENLVTPYLAVPFSVCCSLAAFLRLSQKILYLFVVSTKHDGKLLSISTNYQQLSGKPQNFPQTILDIVILLQNMCSF